MLRPPSWLPVAALLCACQGPSEGTEQASQGESESSSESGENSSEPGCSSPIELPSERPPPVAWAPLAELEIDDQGHSDSVIVPIPGDARYLALRTVPLDGEPGDNEQLCHALLEAQLSEGGTLIPSDEDAPLLDLHQRSYPGPSAGVFVFSSALAPLAGPDELELRVQLRNCVTNTSASRLFFPGMPTRVRIDVASEPTPVPENSGETARLAVRLLVAEDSGWGTASSDPQLAAAWEVAASRFAAAGVTLELDAEGSLAPVGELRYAGDMLTLRPLHDAALACLRADESDTRFVPVLLVPCLRSEQLGGDIATDLGRTPRVPGSFDAPTNPSLVLLSSGQCNFDAPPDPALGSERYGVILAHELGHYLGLHHSDIELGGHLETGPDEQLMRSDIATLEPSAAWFSPAQAQVLRRHPAIVFGP